uniref:EF-hand domain-containing protein n=1 Tax=Alexandrium monilatum TaxID=311494 RepID=A0A7S4R0A5_9DINO|mmetsp:Transcript_91955/g.274394  ORF Transcript_91955/g.274394 Transcript_91955/m.274394 type:complete len:219 (+) Transcript_91955:99-755(+)
MLEFLAGRWLSTVEGEDGDEGLVIIGKDGSLTFVGDGGEGTTRLQEAAAGSDHQLVLLSEEDEQLCTVKLTKKAGADTLRLEGSDGYTEIWNRTSTEDGAPRVVARRPSQARVSRNWTKEGQAGAPKFRAVQAAAAAGAKWGFTSPEAELIKQKFLELDSSGDGMLDVGELGEILKQGRPDISDEEITMLFNEVDEDKTGRISFDEFVEFLFNAQDDE